MKTYPYSKPRKSLLTTKNILIVVSILIVLIFVAIIGFHIKDSHKVNVSSNNTLASTKKAADKKPVLLQPAHSSTKTLSPAVQQAQAAKISKAQLTLAVKDGHITAQQQQQLILAEISRIQEFVATLSATPSLKQDQLISQNEAIWHTWASQNNVPFHYIDPNID